MYKIIISSSNSLLPVNFCLYLLMAFISHFLCFYYILIVLLFSFPMVLSSSNQAQPHLLDHTRREILFEEKTRLGSRPPSCYNKCNQCHPCTAVQVPTLSSLHRVVQAPPPSSVRDSEFDSSLWDYNRYSNYKPLGWKCRCKGHFYNP